MGSRPSSFVLTSPGPMRLYSTQELLSMPPPSWLIEGVLPAGGLCGLYGQPGSGKSFIAMDMALSVAAGGRWLGREVQQGYVLYVAAEGGPGIGKRAKAWLLARGVSARQADIAWLVEPISVYKGSDDIATLMGRMSEELQAVPRFIIIDTLARCFDGDENQQLDMGRFVAGVDELRHEYGATLLVVHHTRLDGERERGNTAFRGGTDTMISVTRQGKSGPITLECTKQKDAEEFENIGLLLKPVPETESAVIVGGRNQKKPLSAGDLLGLLIRHGSMNFKEWLHVAQEGSRVSPATFKRHLVSLREKGEITKENGVYRVS